MNMKLAALSLFVTLSSLPMAQASVVVGIADSGFYPQHNLLQNRLWTNPNDKSGDRIDNDRNGKIDDIQGWNLAENNGFLFSEDEIAMIPEYVFEIYRIIGRIQNNESTAADQEYLDREIRNQPSDQLIYRMGLLNFYGNYAHGTHVAGLVAQTSAEAKLMNMRMFPHVQIPSAPARSGIGTSIWRWIEARILRYFAEQANATFHAAGQYLDFHQVPVANYSLGIPLENLARLYLSLWGINEPTEEELKTEVQKLYSFFSEEGKKWVNGASQTLFVFAAGNSSLNNDEFPAFPSNIQTSNTLSVAAVNSSGELADFSNFGLSSVDVASFGVAQVSAVPAKELSATLPMSGTSMAAPIVTGVVADCKAMNSGLSTGDLKEILMGTVDKKDNLKDVVRSGGIVNKDRAIKAAELSRQFTLATAIQLANDTVADQKLILKSKLMSTESDVKVDTFAKDLARQLVF